MGETTRGYKDKIKTDLIELWCEMWTGFLPVNTTIIQGSILGEEVPGQLSLISTSEELLERKSRNFCLENREYGRGEPLC
jgi:hypothetical protein